MDTLPFRQSKPTSRPQQPPVSKAGQSQPTIDVYLKPIAKARQGQNDIRRYFPPVAKTKKVSSDEECSNSRSPAVTVATPERSQYDDGVAKRETPVPNPSLKPPAASITSIPESRQPIERAPDVFVRARNPNRINPAVPPRSDPFLDNDEHPRSTSPMAPRITDVVVRHSLVPKPLNIKMAPPAVETSRSPSQTTSSPSSVEDPDIPSLDGEGREVPSFKMTYLSVHPRQRTNDSPVSPLTALSAPSPKPLRQRMDRPTTLRSNTAPKFLELSSTDSFKHLLPKISPASESSVDEREPLMRSSYRKPMKKASTRAIFRAKRQAGEYENVSPVHINRRMNSAEDRDVTVSPGLQRYYEILASQEKEAPIKEKRKERGRLYRSKKKEKTLFTETPESGSFVKGEKKGKGFLRLLEAYSKHVEGLQMVQ